MSIAVRWLPPIAIVAGFGTAALLLQPAGVKSSSDSRIRFAPSLVRASYERMRSTTPTTARTIALATATDDVYACFFEWRERQVQDCFGAYRVAPQELESRGSRCSLKLPVDNELRLQLTVRPEAYLSATSIVAGPPSPALRECVAAAFARVTLPHDTDEVDVDVRVLFDGKALIVPIEREHRPAAEQEYWSFASLVESAPASAFVAMAPALQRCFDGQHDAIVELESAFDVWGAGAVNVTAGTRDEPLRDCVVDAVTEVKGVSADKIDVAIAIARAGGVGTVMVRWPEKR